MVTELEDRLLQGDRRALARLITMAENDDPQKNEILRNIYSYTGKGYVLGITGAPGSGKSSLVDKLLKIIRKDDLTVGIIAVDPSSPFTGGAILGDRIRMQEHTLDPGIFIRSMGARGTLGGLSRSTREVVKILDAYGKDIIFVETVGVGQSEVDIVKYADTTVLVLTPAAGDSVQTIKAGVMEIADIFVVNKADIPGADRTITELEAMLDLSPAMDWRPPILRANSLHGEGIEDIWKSACEHRRFLEDSGQLHRVRRERAKREFMDQVECLIKAEVWNRIKEMISIEELVEDLVKRRNDPYTAARELLNRVGFTASEE